MDNTMLIIGLAITFAMLGGSAYGIYLGIHAYLTTTTSIFSWLDLIGGATIISIVCIAFARQALKDDNKTS